MASAALPWVLPRPHELFLLGFETAIWPFRSATRCFYWASKLLSGTFSAPLKSLKTLKTLETFAAAFDGLSLLCHGTSRGPTSCFCWASKLLYGTSEAPQAVSIGLRNCYLARFQRPLKASKPSQQLSTAFRCFAMWVLPRPHELFLLGFETAIWHFRDATSCFYWASKLLSGTLQLSTAFRCFAMGPPEALSGTSEAPQAVSILGFETAIWHLFSTLKSLKTLKTLPAAFDGLSLLCHGSSRGPTSCFCWASKLLSDTSEAPQPVSIGLRNCYLARFQHPLKASKPSKPSQQLSTAFRCFAMGPPRRHKLFLLGVENAIWHVAAFDGHSLLCHGSSRGPTSCFCWASKLLSGTEVPQAVSIGLRNCYLARCSFRRPFAALPWVLPRPHELFLLGFETAIWHVFSTP